MKRIAYHLIIICLFCSAVHAQQNKKPDNVAQLQALLAQAGPDQSTSVGLAADRQALQIGDFLIPLAQTTLVRCEKEGGKYQVRFFLQKGTAITKASDPTFRRAYWALSLHDKKACEQFIALFNELEEK